MKMNDEVTTQELFEALVDVMLERKDIQNNESLLRKTVLGRLLREIESLEYKGFIAILAKNVPRRSVDYDKLENLYPEQYEWLIEKGIIKTSEPKTPTKLVVTPKERTKK